MKDAEEEQETSSITLTIVEKVKSGLFGRKTSDVERDSLTVTYDYRTGRWSGSDNFKDYDGYGHYLGKPLKYGLTSIKSITTMILSHIGRRLTSLGQIQRSMTPNLIPMAMASQQHGNGTGNMIHSLGIITRTSTLSWMASATVRNIRWQVGLLILSSRISILRSMLWEKADCLIHRIIFLKKVTRNNRAIR